VNGVPVYDDSMAGTPAKARAALELFPDLSITLVAGGRALGAAGPVHATDAERELLQAACAMARRKARRTVVFGPAADLLTGLLPGCEVVETLEAAVRLAVAVATGTEAVLIAPMFPVAPEERTRVATRFFPS
jgi:UDP-N-acetylmuramoylalanine-D-glutamate ligase